MCIKLGIIICIIISIYDYYLCLIVYDMIRFYKLFQFKIVWLMYNVFFFSNYVFEYFDFQVLCSIDGDIFFYIGFYFGEYL